MRMNNPTSVEHPVHRDKENDEAFSFTPNGCNFRDLQRTEAIMAISQPFIAASNSIHLSLAPKPYCRARARFSSYPKTPAFPLIDRSQPSNPGRRRSTSTTRLNAGLSAIEPDLPEEKRDRWATNGIDPVVIYSVQCRKTSCMESMMGTTHTMKAKKNMICVSKQFFDMNFCEPGTFWEEVAKAYNGMEPPTGIISWLFLPTVFAGLYYHVPGEYLYIGAAVFVVVFCAIEMGKPSEPHNFEPQIYNMDREARDKLIADYNSMDIWDFNEKYGELWDFTVENNKIIRLFWFPKDVVPSCQLFEVAGIQPKDRMVESWGQFIVLVMNGTTENNADIHQGRVQQSFLVQSSHLNLVPLDDSAQAFGSNGSMNNTNTIFFRITMAR
ncbi:hypothetical protein ACLOJK_032809 [Asimina triloba]